MIELRSRLGKVTVFTKVDVKNGYYLIPMAEGEEWKTVFKSRYVSQMVTKQGRFHKVCWISHYDVA